jgi:xylan 1,4-beta-xylosidase
LHEESGPVPSPFHGGFGLINFQGLRKPAFYAYQFLNRLGAQELVSRDADSWITRGDGGVQVLFWNYTPPKTDESDQVYFKRDLPSLAAGDVQLRLTGLPAGSYSMKVYRVGYGVNDVYTDYMKMGSPPALTREQAHELATRNDGRPVMTSRLSLTSTFSHKIPLRQNDVCLVTLVPLKRPGSKNVKSQE